MSKSNSAKPMPWIYVMTERWFIVGRPRPCEDAMFIELTDACAIRRWGTTMGLGQLALEGKQPNSVFEPEPDLGRINKLDIKRMIPCTGERWKTWNGK